MSHYDWLTPMRDAGREKIDGEWRPLPAERRTLRGQVALDRHTDGTNRLVVMGAPGTFEVDAVISDADAAGMAAALTTPACTCPGGLPDGWRTDFDPGCRRHGTPPVTDDELRALLPAARHAMRQAVGARTSVYHDDPAGTHLDGFLVNVITAVLNELRTPTEVRALDTGKPQ